MAISYGEMVAVKQWFRQNYHHDLVKNLYTDLHRFGSALESEDPRMTTDLFNIMIGYQRSGWTINQAAQELKIKIDDIQYLRHDEMLAVSAYARNFPGPLQQLLLPLINESPLNRSAQVTFDLYTQGEPIELIAQERRLKENTIREHLLEAAILIPDKLDWDILLPESKRDELSRFYKGEPTAWKFDEQIASFYEYRLYQIFQGITNEK
ncbi:helix-turn-helix domain-containing protein [Limosilactobacillus reuteri]|nr:helix-turn-helix domain-containing protein [Limosilactobacillus reuteri]